MTNNQGKPIAFTCTAHNRSSESANPLAADYFILECNRANLQAIKDALVDHSINQVDMARMYPLRAKELREASDRSATLANAIVQAMAWGSSELS